MTDTNPTPEQNPDVETDTDQSNDEDQFNTGNEDTALRREGNKTQR